ncbi:hypothetical protein [Micromonospora humi]|uniref:Major facilitator superfamily (MFS) profile domain-containing protein n=1 Tax=Micromonospora humi TaxID=745366 RepID=A0A1C5K786_9ACTN|nr:hypothetical protein [Micromonospora humi]SCG78481.1 hypothetical protein GA0070213_12142 [Micromonospora humi]
MARAIGSAAGPEPAGGARPGAHLLRNATPGREATAGAIGITVLNLGIAAGATLGGAVLDRRPAGALPAVAAVVIAAAALGLVLERARTGRPARGVPA